MIFVQLETLLPFHRRRRRLRLGLHMAHTFTIYSSSSFFSCFLYSLVRATDSLLMLFILPIMKKVACHGLDRRPLGPFFFLFLFSKATRERAALKTLNREAPANIFYRFLFLEDGHSFQINTRVIINNNLHLLLFLFLLTYRRTARR